VSAGCAIAFRVHGTGARSIVIEALAGQTEGCWLAPDVADDLLRTAGIPVAAIEIVYSADAAVAAGGGSAPLWR
jgi:hypothetical protein